MGTRTNVRQDKRRTDKRWTDKRWTDKHWTDKRRTGPTWDRTNVDRDKRGTGQT